MMKLIIPSLVLLLLGPTAPVAIELTRVLPVPTTQPVSSATTQPAGKVVKLPGLLIYLEQGYVDVEAEVCLEQGTLELIACTKGTKEHESIVAIAARPMHVHTALLLLGANNGHPARWEPADEEKTRWIDLPPRGDWIQVSLVVATADGKVTESPISKFIAPSEDHSAERGPDGKTANEERFPDRFLFAGSVLRDQDEGPRQYLADVSGNVISISTFGDEVLCLPEVHSQQSGALLWQVDPTHLPKPGSRVILRLRPQKPLDDGKKP
jgi:hypothetical protein